MVSHSYLVVLYKSGAVCHFPPDSLHFKLGNKAKRGMIGSCSRRSMIRGAWTLGNMPKEWGVMVTLTHRIIPTDVKQALKKFLRSFRLHNGTGVQWAWFMEFQKRGAVHFHFFLEKEWCETNGFLDAIEILHRRKSKQAVTVVRGQLESYLVGLWMDCIEDHSEATARFMFGGVVECLRNADGAGRYMARYVGKESQKTLPHGAAACGRWWAINPRYKPQAQSRKVLKFWPFPFRYKHLFNKDDLNELVMLDAENIPRVTPDWLNPTIDRREYVLNDVTQLNKGVVGLQSSLRLDYRKKKGGV